MRTKMVILSLVVFSCVFSFASNVLATNCSAKYSPYVIEFYSGYSAGSSNSGEPLFSGSGAWGDSDCCPPEYLTYTKSRAVVMCV